MVMTKFCCFQTVANEIGFFRPPRPEFGISRFADRKNVSATSANEIKLVALVETLVATLEKFAAAVENLVVAWYFKLVAAVIMTTP